MTVCEHKEVTRSDYVHNRPYWKCDKCNTEFIPAFAVTGLVEQVSEERVDLTVGIAAAMMWDFHERAVEKYGEGSPQAEALQPGHDAPEDDDPCSEGHDFKDGVCQRCPTSQFLGSN